MSNVETLASKIEAVLASGDLSKFSAEERVAYVTSVCESVGLNPLTRPFEYQTFQGKLVLYARKDATEQLRKIHRISVTDIKKEIIGDLLHITVYGQDATGKSDLATGVVPIANLKGVDLANAYLKCETKAKRRFTLSICGLGILDESELEDLRTASQTRDVRAKQIEARLAEEIELDPEPPLEPQDFLTEAASEPPKPDLGEYVVKVGKNKGKRLKEISRDKLESTVTYLQEQESIHPSVQEFLNVAIEYLTLGA